MIHKMFNLICADGHRHYSPVPELFVGRGCSHTPFAGMKKCELPLKRYTNPDA